MSISMSRWVGAVAGLAAVTSILASPGGLVAQEATGRQVAAGAAVYGDMCGRCHNPRSPLERSDRDWVTIINHMRVRANLTGRQVKDVLAFLQATNTSPAERVPLPAAAPTREETPVAVGDVSTDPAVIARGTALVEQKACVGCHVIGTAGGQVGPSLNGVVKRRGPDFVRKKLADPTFNNATSMMPNFGLTMDEIESIVAYLNTLDGK